MSLMLNQGLFYYRGDYSDSDLARRAGFAWKKEERAWVTPYALVAKRVAVTPEERRLVISRLETEEMTRLQSAAITSDCTPPAPAGMKYMNFQRAGIERLLVTPRALLADEPGLGKTIQAIGAMNVSRPGTVLIVCPASLKLNWLKEWQKWSTLKLTVGVANGVSVPHTAAIIINYDILGRNRAKVAGVNWDYLVLDEAHMLANQKANRTQAICGTTYPALIKPLAAKRCIAITGTPFLNRPIELHSALKFLYPEGWPSRMEYALRYCNAQRNNFGWDMNGASHLEEFQAKLRSTIMIRRMKKDVMKELPRKVRQVIEIQPDGKTAKYLAAREKGVLQKVLRHLGFQKAEGLSEAEFREVIRVMQGGLAVPFEEMSTLRKEMAIAKCDFVIQHLEGAISESGKVVCFAHHLEVVKRIKAHFGARCVTLTGSSTSWERDNAVTRFQTEPGLPLFVGNIQAAGVGITLTAASRAVMAELDWRPGMMAQAEDRLHRIGAEAESIFYQYLVYAGSLDSAMAKANVQKQEVIESALDMNTEREIERMLS